jgi:hypothetical protein
MIFSKVITYYKVLLLKSLLIKLLLLLLLFVETLKYFKVRKEGQLPDSQISATSFSVGNEPPQVRLNRRGWCSGEQNPSPESLVINTGNFHSISIIVTKGGLKLDGELHGWVKSFHLHYGMNGMNWNPATILNETVSLSLMIRN